MRRRGEQPYFYPDQGGSGEKEEDGDKDKEPKGPYDDSLREAGVPMEKYREQLRERARKLKEQKEQRRLLSEADTAEIKTPEAEKSRIEEEMEIWRDMAGNIRIIMDRGEDIGVDELTWLLNYTAELIEAMSLFSSGREKWSDSRKEMEEFLASMREYRDGRESGDADQTD